MKDFFFADSGCFMQIFSGVSEDIVGLREWRWQFIKFQKTFGGIQKRNTGVFRDF